MSIFKKPDLKKLQSYVMDAKYALRASRALSWVDSIAVDGQILSPEEESFMRESGVEPIDINRIFPVVNLLMGTQAVNKSNIIAKGRTTEDSDVGKLATEGIRFVLDQNLGQLSISRAFEDQIKAGFGFVGVGLNDDPREERVAVRYVPWTECYWDPFADPWLNPRTCRYFFKEKWVDLDFLIAHFPSKKQELKEAYKVGSSSKFSGKGDFFEDEADFIENSRFLYGSQVDTSRKRMKPVEIYYSVMEECLFGVLPGDRVVEIKKEMNESEVYSIFKSCVAIKPATVRKMRVCTFVGDVILQDMETPFYHDLFPFAPFVGYLDSANLPYGVVRQVLGQAKEVVKRRSMALALLKAKSVEIEEDAVPDKPNKESALQQIYDEAQKLDSFFVLKSGGLSHGKFRTTPLSGLANDQFAILSQSEREISEISGPNKEAMGYHSNATSGVALERRQAQAATVTAPLYEHYNISLNTIGTLILSTIQKEWAAEKVLRVTDDMSGTEKFVVLNKKIQEADGSYRIENNISQGKFDIIISRAPLTDTVREQYINLISEWVKKSPPQIIPFLIEMAFELSDLPNKEELMTKIRPALGLSSGDEELSEEELMMLQQQKEIQAKEEEKQAFHKEMLEKMALEANQLENLEKKAKVEKLIAEVRKIDSEIDIKKLKQSIVNEEAGIKAFEKGVKLGERGI